MLRPPGVRQWGPSGSGGGGSIHAPPEPSLFEQVLALAAGRPVFTADHFELDSVSGKVRAFVDWNDPTHRLLQVNAAQQVAPPSPEATMSGALCVTATASLYISDRPASAWNFTADGVSCESYRVFAPYPQGLGVLDVTASQAGHSGQQLFIDPNPHARLIAPLGFTDIGGGAAPSPTATYMGFRISAASSNHAELRVRSALVAASPFGVPPGPVATYPLCLFANGPSGQFGYIGRWRALPFFPALDAAGRSIVQAWIQADTGISP